VEGEKGGEKVTAAHNIPTPYQTKSRTLERTCNGGGDFDVLNTPVKKILLHLNSIYKKRLKIICHGRNTCTKCMHAKYLGYYTIVLKIKSCFTIFCVFLL
jgi:hypothetical protein